jgi:hypothetical protein
LGFLYNTWNGVAGFDKKMVRLEKVCSSSRPRLIEAEKEARRICGLFGTNHNWKLVVALEAVILVDSPLRCVANCCIEIKVVGF